MFTAYSAASPGASAMMTRLSSFVALALGPRLRARHHHRMLTERVEHDHLAVNHHAVELEGLVEPASGPLEPRRQDDRQALDGQRLALVRQLDERGARASRIVIHDAVDEQVARVE